MQRRRRVGLVAAGLAGALTVTVAPTPAFADSAQCSLPTATCAARATFTSYGEIFHVYDQAADGHSAVVLYWLADGSGPYYGWAHSGNGTSIEVNLDLPEGDWIFYQTCLGEYGTKTLVAGSCNAGVTDYA